MNKQIDVNRESALLLALDQAANVVFITDLDGRIEYVNRAFTEVTGYFPQEVIGRTPGLLNSGYLAPAVFRNLWDTLAAGGSWKGLFHNRRKDGSRFWARATVSPVLDPSGRPFRFVTIQEDATVEVEERKKLELTSRLDPLTGLPNRIAFFDSADRLLRAVKNREPSLAVLYLDLDRFKHVNDRLGHEAGDRVLVSVARRLSRSIRPNELVARLGGDEFAFLLSEVDAEEARVVASRVRDTLVRPFRVAGRIVRLGASLGVATIPRDGTDLSLVLCKADQAMYAAKASGGGVRVYPG